MCESVRANKRTVCSREKERERRLLEKEKSRMELEKVSKGVGLVGKRKEGPTKLLFLRPYRPIGRQEYSVHGHFVSVDFGYWRGFAFAFCLFNNICIHHTLPFLCLAV